MERRNNKISFGYTPLKYIYNAYTAIVSKEGNGRNRTCTAKGIVRINSNFTEQGILTIDIRSQRGSGYNAATYGLCALFGNKKNAKSES